jgi:regulator of replication initiation timing
MTKRTSESGTEIDLNKAIEEVDFDALEPNLRILLRLLLNKVEELEKTVKDLRIENQQLRDGNNRLKGEQGKPNIRPQTPSRNISSEAERKNLTLKKTRKSKAKNHKITINRHEGVGWTRVHYPLMQFLKGAGQ